MNVVPDNAPHILIIDDDARLRSLLRRYLLQNNFRISEARDAEVARKIMEIFSFNILILDVMMPGETGLQLAASLRESSDIPIIMLTAKADPDDRILGLETGVNDYLTKPFEPKELLLRIENILKYQWKDEFENDIYSFGKFQYDSDRNVILKNGQPSHFSDIEIGLIEQLARARGEPVERHKLAGQDERVNDRSIDVQITRLRQKIEVNPSEPQYLLTVRGQGYRLILD